MWTCTRMSFTSYTFTSLPLVHTLNPDFLGRRLWLCFSQVRESPRSRNLLPSCLPNLTSRRLPNFMISQVHGVGSSRIRDFGASSVRDSRSLHVRDFGGFAGSRFQIFAHSRLRSFASSRFQIFVSSVFLKTHYTNFIYLDVSRVTSFPEFPNKKQGWMAAHLIGAVNMWCLLDSSTTTSMWTLVWKIQLLHFSMTLVQWWGIQIAISWHISNLE
jgi:hypothetical protein